MHVELRAEQHKPNLHARIPIRQLRVIVADKHSMGALAKRLGNYEASRPRRCPMYAPPQCHGLGVSFVIAFV